MWWCDVSLVSYQDTRSDNFGGAVLPRAGAPSPAPVRGAARLFRRRGAVGGGRPPVRLSARLLSPPLLALPASGGARVLSGQPARAPTPAPEGRRARPDHRPAQGQLLRLRHP